MRNCGGSEVDGVPTPQMPYEITRVEFKWKVAYDVVAYSRKKNPEKQHEFCLR